MVVSRRSLVSLSSCDRSRDRDLAPTGVLENETTIATGAV